MFATVAEIEEEMGRKGTAAKRWIGGGREHNGGQGWGGSLYACILGDLREKQESSLDGSQY